MTRLTIECRLALESKFSRRGHAVYPSPATRGTNVVAMRSLAALGLVTLEEFGVGAWRATLTAEGRRVRKALTPPAPPSWDR